MLIEVRVIYLAFLKICLFKIKPQDIPVSSSLLAMTIVTYAIVTMFLLLVRETVAQAIMMTLLEVSILFGFIYILLRLVKKPERSLQTLSALYGTGTILSLIVLPLYFIISMYDQQPVNPNVIFSLLQFLLISLTIWNITVMSYIMRHSFEAGVFTSVMLAISYMCIVLSMSAFLFTTEGVS